MAPDQPERDEPTEHPAVSEPRHREDAAGMLHRLSRRLSGVRSWFHARPGGRHIWRAAVTLIGLAAIVVGIILLAAPGPGWLVIFLGLGIWATEFAWAKSLLRRTRRTVGRWTAWLGRQPRWLTALAGAAGLIALGAIVAGAWLLTSNS